LAFVRVNAPFATLNAPFARVNAQNHRLFSEIKTFATLNAPFLCSNFQKVHLPLQFTLFSAPCESFPQSGTMFHRQTENEARLWCRMKS